MGHFIEVEGASRGIEVLWNPLTIKGEILEEGKHWLHAKFNLLHNNDFFFITNTYELVSTIDKRELWQKLSGRLELSRDEKGIIIGDFNTILNAQENMGGLQRITMVQRNFQSFVDNNQLMDIIPRNGLLTWTNKRDGFTNIAERLVIFLMYGD